MSEVIALVRPPGAQGTPTYRVRCAGCRRVYLTTSHRKAIERLTGCVACKRHGRRADRAGDKACANCGEPAACFGSYETELNPAYACDECCAHGNEDGHCETVTP